MKIRKMDEERMGEKQVRSEKESKRNGIALRTSRIQIPSGLSRFSSVPPGKRYGISALHHSSIIVQFDTVQSELLSAWLGNYTANIYNTERETDVQIERK